MEPNGTNIIRDGFREVMTSIRSASECDKYVGECVREFRGEKGMSQQDLANRIAVSLQQLQKYERGANRISAGRLAQIAEALSKPIAAFFPSAEPIAVPDHPLIPDADRELVQFQRSAEGRELSRAFARIRRRLTRKRIVHLVQTVADVNDGSRAGD